MKENNFQYMKKNKLYLLHFLLLAVLIFADQLTKFLARSAFSDGSSKAVISKVLSFCLHKNTGAAWSTLQGHTVYLSVFSIILLILILFIYFISPNAGKRMNTFRLLLVFIMAGAVGNLIDRLFFGYVTDFIYFEIINFPVFNIADCYITVTAFLFFFMMFFYFKDEDFGFLSRKKQERK